MGGEGGRGAGRGRGGGWGSAQRRAGRTIERSDETTERNVNTRSRSSRRQEGRLLDGPLQLRWTARSTPLQSNSNTLPTRPHTSRRLGFAPRTSASNTPLSGSEYTYTTQALRLLAAGPLWEALPVLPSARELCMNFDVSVVQVKCNKFLESESAVRSLAGRLPSCVAHSLGVTPCDDHVDDDDLG